MNDVSYPVDLEALSERLLEIAKAQATALWSDNLMEFDRLCIEREDLQGMLDMAIPGQALSPALGRLHEVLAVDLSSTDLIRRLASETSIEARQFQHAHAALRGYGRPSSEQISRIIDTQR